MSTNIHQAGKEDWVKWDVHSAGANGGGANHGLHAPDGKTRTPPSPGTWNSANAKRYPGASEQDIALHIARKDEQERQAFLRKAEAHEQNQIAKVTRRNGGSVDFTDKKTIDAITTVTREASRLLGTLQPVHKRQSRLTVLLMDLLVREGFPYYHPEPGRGGDLKVMVDKVPVDGTTHAYRYVANFARATEEGPHESRKVFIGRNW